MKILVPGLVVVCIGSAGCDDSDGGGGGGGGGGGPDATASGVAIKGPVADAEVTIFALRPTGALGEVVGEGTSNAAGEFSVTVSDHLGWAVARVSGGTYTDEATGASLSIPAGQPLVGFVDVQENSIDHTITPLTTIAFSLMQYFALDPEATLDDSIQNALATTENFFGLEDIELAVPVSLTQGAVPPSPEADYGAVVAGLSELADLESVDPMELVHALASDAADGRFDGRAFGADVPLGAGTLSPTAGTGDLGRAIRDFLVSPENTSGLVPDDTLVDDELAGSAGLFDWPIQVRSLVNGYGLTEETVAARLEVLSVPGAPQILIETQVLQITSRTAENIVFEIPPGLALGLHDLIVRDQDSGLRTRLRDAVEVFDPSAAPTVNEVTPPAGPLTGGTLLQIRGTNFGPDTRVEVGGTPAARIAEDFPRWMVVSTPAGVAGAVDVTVRNGLADAVVTDAFELRSGDTRANPELPSLLAPIVFGAFRNFEDPAGVLTAQALVGRSTFTSSFSGNFSLTEFTSTELAPAIVTFQHGGTTDQAPESLARAFRLLVITNALADAGGEGPGNFFRGFTNEENGVHLGATAFGPACFFPEPTGMQVGTLARTYWVNGVEANLGQGSLRQKTGWLELDDSFQGSATLLAHGRDFGGTAFDLGHETWDIAFTLGANGAFQGTRTSGDSTEPLLGRFSSGAELGFLIQDGSDDTLAYYLLTPVQHGVEAGAFGGWIGGYLRHEIVPGVIGPESAFESGTTRGLIARTETGSSELAFNRATRVTQSDVEGSFREYVGAVELDVSPSGRIFAGPDLAGFVNTGDGILLGTGRFPNECLLEGGVDRPIVLGGATFRESRKSLDSLSPARKQIAIEAKFLEAGTTRQQELGTDLFDVTLDPATPPTVMGVTIPLAGTVPALEAAAISGLHKSTLRADTGKVTTTRGNPPHWGVEVGYCFVDDTLDLFVTQVTQPNGRFAGAELPRWIGSGTLGNDGQVAVLRGNDEFLGDGLVFLVANPGTGLAEPNYLVTAGGLAFEPNEGGLSGVASSRTELEFVGNGTVAVTRASHTESEDGNHATDATAGLGLNTAPSGQSIRLNIPDGRAPDREWETFWTSTGDAFVGIDDTPESDTVELLLGIRPAIGGSFVDDDRNLIVLELDPELSRATTQQLELLPRSGPFLTGEIFSSRRGAGHALLHGQSFVTTAPVDTFQGEASVPFVGDTPVLKFLFNEREEAAGQEDLTLLLTPRIIHSIDG